MNITTVYKAMHKQAAGASGEWNSRPYTNKRVSNQPTWEAPEGYSNKSWLGQIGDNLSNWFKQKTWDSNHAIDTLFGTNLTKGQKRVQDKDYNGSFWGAINPFGQKPQTDIQVRKMTDWQKRKQQELKGEMPRVDDITKYNASIELPNNKAFKNMALQKANDQRYIKLRHQGMNNEQIANYIMREEMLPLMREATGKQNIIPSMKLTDAQMNRIKENMLDQQMAAAQRRMSRIDPATGASNNEDWSEDFRKQYRDTLSKNFDSFMNDTKQYKPMENAATANAISNSSAILNRNKTVADNQPKPKAVGTVNGVKDIPGTFRQL